MSGGLGDFLRFWASKGLGLLLGMALVVAALLALIRLFAIPQVALPEQLVGAVGQALTDVSALEGKVDLEGRTVRAVADQPITKGSPVRVLRVDGLVAKVTRIEPS